MTRTILITMLLVGFGGQTCAQSIAKLLKEKEQIAASLDKQSQAYADVAKKIWEYAGPGYLEEKSAAMLRQQRDRKPPLDYRK